MELLDMLLGGRIIDNKVITKMNTKVAENYKIHGQLRKCVLFIAMI